MQINKQFVNSFTFFVLKRSFPKSSKVKFSVLFITDWIFWNIREAAPEAGTNFINREFSAAVLCKFNNTSNSDSLIFTIPSPSVQGLTSSGILTPLINNFNWSFMDSKSSWLKSNSERFCFRIFICSSTCFIKIFKTLRCWYQGLTQV